MKTHYIRFMKIYMDPVWGMQAIPWVRTPLVRVTRNSLRKARFEWVGNARREFDLPLILSLYPLVMYPVEIRDGRRVGADRRASRPIRARCPLGAG